MSDELMVLCGYEVTKARSYNIQRLRTSEGHFVPEYPGENRVSGPVTHHNESGLVRRDDPPICETL